MILVFAQEHDEYAKDLVRRWRDRGTRLMVPGDLSRAGWSCSSRNPNDSRCVIEGARCDSSEIRGVLVRLPAVFAADLPHIAVSDRDYVASEMTAFLVYWLNALGKPLLNRPTPRSLAGPGWFPEHWTYYAAQTGMRVQPIGRSIKPASIDQPAWAEHNGSFAELTVVAGVSCFGEVTPGLAAKAQALAAAACVDLVKFRFDGPGHDACFLQADLYPPLDDPRVEQAVLDYFA
jgi:hypothetical protein